MCLFVYFIYILLLSHNEFGWQGKLNVNISLSFFSFWPLNFIKNCSQSLCIRYTYDLYTDKINDENWNGNEIRYDSPILLTQQKCLIQQKCQRTINQMIVVGIHKNIQHYDGFVQTNTFQNRFIAKTNDIGIVNWTNVDSTIQCCWFSIHTINYLSI